MKKMTLMLAAVALSVSALAYNYGPVFKDFSVPKPADFKKVTAAELKLTDQFLKDYPEGMPTMTQEGLYRLYDFYRNDPDGQREWTGMAKRTARLVSGWDLSKTGGFGGSRYIYSLSALKGFAITYMFTGNRTVFQFIEAHLKKITALPMEFWIHAELRAYNPQKPCGTLETAQLNQMLGFALAACKKDMAPEDVTALEKAWYERGLVTASNWLDKPAKNNFTAVIASGLLYAAKYFNDDAAGQKAFKCLKQYAENAIQPDGSYDEGYGYFSYPIGNLVRAALVMTKEEIAQVYGDSPLKGSMKWRVYGAMFNLSGDKAGGYRLNYGDNDYDDRSGFGADMPSYFNAIVYRDPLSYWLRDKFGSRYTSDQLVLEQKYAGESPVEPMSPKELRLPLAAAFGNGDAYIRNNWDDEGIVLSLKAGDGGSRTGYSHCRPEFNSIQLGAFGDYLIVNAGSASYRSFIHYEYDGLTKAANTVTVDDMNQKMPRNASKGKNKWNSWDNSACWVKGFPHASVTRCESTPDGGSIIRSEALDAYHLEMTEAFRTVQFIPGEEFFIVVDKYTPADGQVHKFDSRLHIFNRDSATVISGKPEMLKVKRDIATLYIAFKSNLKPSLNREKGYLHGPSGRDYDPNGPKQGALGSSIGLDWTAQGKSFHSVMVIYPRKTGSKAPVIKFSGKQVTVNGVKYDIPE